MYISYYNENKISPVGVKSIFPSTKINEITFTGSNASY